MLAWSAFLLLFPLCLCQHAEYNKPLEEKLLKDYNRRHRPVKKDTTTVNVNVYMSISHVEKVDEHEQTMLLHGHLWAWWTDEYMMWQPGDWNGTSKINVDSWKLWQPALALYNSARGNTWHLYMHGLPAMVSYNGMVWTSGSFSFHVTCKFDFSSWPYDEQECPIVIADWVYDLSRVNLSDTLGDQPWNRPNVRLNYDPLNENEKKHVAGWEVKETWRKHCYWGPNGCKPEVPEGQPEWYWSLLEFGIRIKRHAPYILLTVIMPTVLTSLLTLCSFWIDQATLAQALLVFNVLLQGLFGWDLIRQLPPGSGSVPKIVSLYGLNLSLTTLALLYHVLSQWAESVLPDTVTIPVELDSVVARLRLSNLFAVKGLSFDPQLLMNGDLDDHKDYNPPLTTVGSSASLGLALGIDSTIDSETDTLVDIESGLGGGAEGVSSNDDGNVSLIEPSTSASAESLASAPLPDQSAFSSQLHTIRRMLFILYAITYTIALPICLF